MGRMRQSIFRSNAASLSSSSMGMAMGGLSLIVWGDFSAMVCLFYRFLLRWTCLGVDCRNANSNNSNRASKKTASVSDKPP